MKKLIKADLPAILRLAEVYQPLNVGEIETDIRTLYRREHTDYLFLARRERSWLFGLPAVYERDSYANTTFLAYTERSVWPVLALLLHVDKEVESTPWGSVTLLDYRAAALDVEVFSQLPQAQRDRHIQLVAKRCARNARYCTILEVIQYLKTGEVK